MNQPTGGYTREQRNLPVKKRYICDKHLCKYLKVAKSNTSYQNHCLKAIEFQRNKEPLKDVTSKENIHAECETEMKKRKYLENIISRVKSHVSSYNKKDKSKHSIKLITEKSEALKKAFFNNTEEIKIFQVFKVENIEEVNLNTEEAGNTKANKKVGIKIVKHEEVYTSKLL